jgi:hypothetical protein
MLEEFHATEHVEHGGLLHPVAQGEELSGDSIMLGILFAFLRADMHNPLGRDSEVLIVESFFIPNGYQIEGAVLVRRHWLPVAVQKLDRRVVAVLGEKRYSLFTSFDLSEQLVDVGAFPDEVGSSRLHGLALLLILVILDYLSKLFKVNRLAGCILTLQYQMIIRACPMNKIWLEECPPRIFLSQTLLYASR